MGGGQGDGGEAGDVADAALARAASTCWTTLANDHAKRAHELEVFSEFIVASQLKIALESVSQRDPPEPDVWCLRNGEAVYFELGRLLDNEMQKMKIDAMRCAPRPVNTTKYVVKLPEREMLRRKIAKTYETNGTPIELLLYYDKSSWLVGDVPVVADFRWHAIHVMQPILDTQSHLRRLWVYERHRKTVLWTGLPTGKSNKQKT